MFPRLDLCLLCSVWACPHQIPNLFSLQVQPRTALTPPLSPTLGTFAIPVGDTFSFHNWGHCVMEYYGHLVCVGQGCCKHPSVPRMASYDKALSVNGTKGEELCSCLLCI